jgi:hypothetical protein
MSDDNHKSRGTGTPRPDFKREGRPRDGAAPRARFPRDAERAAPETRAQQ